jgi:biotin carboxylase
MNVIFLSPAYPLEMQDYVRGLAEVGANVIGVGEGPASMLPSKIKRYCSEYIQVSKLFDETSLIEQVCRWSKGKSIDRVESLWEPLTLPAAKIRKQLGIPGMSPQTVLGFRDKSIMKDRIKAAGLRVPHAFRCRTEKQICASVEKLGFPVIIKPIAGAGSADTYRVDDSASLERTIKMIGHVKEVSVEEFIDGREFTYDTVCVNGLPKYENVAEYLPRPLIARSNEWISPIIITLKDLNSNHIQQGISLGRGVLKALNMGDGFTHMEWYLTPKGEVVFGEIGCRPGGAHLVDQMNFTSDIDLFREWARAVCWKDVQINNPRKYNTSIIFKRAMGKGKIRHITGLMKFLHNYGPTVCVENLLKPGQNRRDWRQTLVSDGFVIIRHKDWEVAKQISERFAVDVQLIASN